MMPGTLPALRRRRLAPVPCVSRLRALISIAIASLLRFSPALRPETGGLKNLFDKKPTDGAFRLKADNRFRNQGRGPPLPELPSCAGVVAPPDGGGGPPPSPRPTWELVRRPPPGEPG